MPFQHSIDNTPLTDEEYNLLKESLGSYTDTLSSESQSGEDDAKVVSLSILFTRVFGDN